MQACQQHIAFDYSEFGHTPNLAFYFSVKKSLDMKVIFGHVGVFTVLMVSSVCCTQTTQKTVCKAVAFTAACKWKR